MDQLAIDFDAARAQGEQAAEACLAKAQAVASFDSEGAARFITGWIVRNGETSGEDLVDAAVAHGYHVHDRRAFGGVFKRLLGSNTIRVLRSDLPRKRGHGTSGGRLYGITR